MTGLVYLIPTRPNRQIWNSSRMPLAVAAIASSTYWATELRDRSIQWQELYPIALACLLWGNQWSGKKLLFHNDNQTIVDIWASGTSQDPLIMHLVRSIFFSAATNHYTVLVTHIVGTNNSIADSLSRLQISQFRHLAPTADLEPTPVPMSAVTLWNTAYLAGIRFAHTESSLPDPFQEAPLLSLLLHGIKSTMGLSSRQRLPITMVLLRQIKEKLARAPDFLPSDKLMLWSSFTLAFYGFLRCSKFTSPSATQFNSQVHLCFTDVSFTSEGCLTLHLKSSKTDPCRQGCSLLIAPSRCSVCAVRALRKYLSLRLVSGASPLYVFQSGAYLTRAKVTSTLHTLLKRLSIPTELYASHSFRIAQLLPQPKLVCHLG